MQAMDGTTKRLRIGDVVTNMFRTVLALSPGELVADLTLEHTDGSLQGMDVNSGCGRLYCWGLAWHSISVASL